MLDVECCGFPCPFSPVIKALFLLPLLLLGAGCTQVGVQTLPQLDMSRYQRVFVIEPFNENRHVDKMFVQELRATGREAWSGPRTMMPEEADAVLTYHARWTWDFKTYLIDLTIELHTSHTTKKLAEGRYYQPSVQPHPPEVAVRELVQRLFSKKGVEEGNKGVRE